MDFIFPQTTPIFPVPPLWIAMAPVSAIPPARQQDRITRVSTLTPQDMSAGLLRLSMNYPAACDAMLDKVQYDAIDDHRPNGTCQREKGVLRSRSCWALCCVVPRRQLGVLCVLRVACWGVAVRRFR